MTKLPLTPEDVNKTTDPLTRLHRMILFKRGIDTNRFYELHKKNFGEGFFGNDKKAMATHRNNLSRTLVEPTITWRKFLTTQMNLMNCTPVSLTIVIKDNDTGELTTYTTDEVAKAEVNDKECPSFDGLEEFSITIKDPDGKLTTYDSAIPLPVVNDILTDLEGNIVSDPDDVVDLDEEGRPIESDDDDDDEEGDED